MATYFSDFGVFEWYDLLPAVHGGHGGGGLVAVIDHLLEALTRDQPSHWSLLGGIETLGVNIHPLLVHFPIAFLFGFLLTEVYGMLFKKKEARRLASGLLYLGAFSAVITAAAGLFAAVTVPHGATVHEIMEWHEKAGLTVAGLSVAMALWRRFGGIPAAAMSQTLSLLLTIILAVVLFLGADMGGMMVYRHGVAVQAVQALQTPTEHHHHDHGAGE